MAQIYVELIKKGLKTIDDVPNGYIIEYNFYILYFVIYSFQ